MKKLSLLLCLVLLIAMFVGCGDSDTDTANPNAPSDDIFSTEAVSFKDANSDANYSIVRSDSASNDVSTAALSVFHQYKKTLGVSPKNQTDSVDAAKYFVENYFKSSSVEGGIKYTHKTEGQFTDVTVNGVALGKFTIIRPRINSSYITYAEVEKFTEMMLEYTGYKMYIKDDTVTEETDYELIIGDCARPNVTKVDNRDEYKITV